MSDFVTLHVVKTPETLGLIGNELLALAKPGLRIVNVSRGGVIDEDALAEAIREGRVGGAAHRRVRRGADHQSPLFELTQVVVTPHLGASTAEAQDKAGDTIAEQVGPGARRRVRAVRRQRERRRGVETVRPFLPLAERLGQLYAGLAAGVPDVLEIEYQGQLADYDTRILTLSVLKGVFGRVSDEPVSYVNAPRIAEERGIEVRESSSSTSRDYVNLVTSAAATTPSAARSSGLRAEPRIVMVDDHSVDLPAGRPHARRPQRRRARDDRRRSPACSARPASTSTTCTSAAPPRAAPPLMVLATDAAVPDDVQGAIRAARPASSQRRRRCSRGWTQRFGGAQAVGFGGGGVARSSGPGWCGRSSPSPAGGRSSSASFAFTGWLVGHTPAVGSTQRWPARLGGGSVRSGRGSPRRSTGAAATAGSLARRGHGSGGASGPAGVGCLAVAAASRARRRSPPSRPSSKPEAEQASDHGATVVRDLSCLDATRARRDDGRA